jgi:hypothetical protein
MHDAGEEQLVAGGFLRYPTGCVACATHYPGQNLTGPPSNSVVMTHGGRRKCCVKDDSERTTLTRKLEWREQQLFQSRKYRTMVGRGDIMRVMSGRAYTPSPST